MFSFVLAGCWELCNSGEWFGVEGFGVRSVQSRGVQDLQRLMLVLGLRIWRLVYC